MKDLSKLSTQLRGTARRQWLQRVAAFATVAAAAAADAAGIAAVDPTATHGATGATAGIGDDDPFAFGLIGDTSYLPFESEALDRVLAAMDDDALACVIHVGDLKSGSSACTDDDMQRRIAQLDRSRHPLILTPGDNDWTDCHRTDRTSASREDVARARLQWLRRAAFGQSSSLGREPMPLDVQSAAVPENRRWRIGSLVFCTIHVVGSDDGRRLQRDAPSRDWLARREANLQWITEAVDRAMATRARGLVIALHADMGWPRRRTLVDESTDAYADIRRAIVSAAERFGRPMLLAHGDSHLFKDDRLLHDGGGPPNLQRVICHGTPFSRSWVRIGWNPRGVAETHDPQQAAFLISSRQIAA